MWLTAKLDLLSPQPKLAEFPELPLPWATPAAHFDPPEVRPVRPLRFAAPPQLPQLKPEKEKPP